MVKYENIQYLRKDAIRIIDIYFYAPSISTVDYHYHRSLEIILPIIGSVKVYSNGESRVIYPGGMYIINSGDIHYLEGQLDEGYYKGYAFQIPYRTLAFCAENIDMLRFINTKRAHDQLLSILYQILLMDMNNHSYKHIMIAQSTLDIIRILLVNGTEQKGHTNLVCIQQKEVVIAAISYIRDHYNENLTVRKLADYFNYSYGHFEKMFKDFTGMTATQCIKEVQLQYVEEALLTTNESILAISEKIGFPNVKSLQHSFKTKFNMTANQYRMKMRN